MNENVSTIRPLKRIEPGVWESRDGRWRFNRHESDPKPQRWFAFLDGDDEPYWSGMGHTRLADVVREVETTKL